MLFLRRPSTLALALAVTAGVLTGCGGTSTSRPSAQIRAVDASTNGGTTTVIFNGAAPFGDQTLASLPSSYLFVESKGTSTVTYSTVTVNADKTTTTNLLAGATALNATVTLSSNTNYTAYLIGRPDLVKATGSDPRAMRVVVFPDSPPSRGSGQATVRILDAAPDAGNVDVVIDHTTILTNVAYPSLSSYLTVSGGTHAVQINKTGTTTPLFAAVSASVTAGKSDTWIITEPTSPTVSVPGRPFSYGLKTFED